MEKSQKHYLSAAGQTQKLYATWLNCYDISEKVNYRKISQIRTEVRSVRDMKELCWVMKYSNLIVVVVTQPDTLHCFLRERANVTVHKF